jgi:hypothetical protein
MTAAQHRKYLSEWGLVRKIFRAKGLEPKACDAKRHELHKRALNYDKSSLDLTNSEFDSILAVFSAISRPADLKTQLRLQEQAPARLDRLHARAAELLGQLDIKPAGREEYLDFLSRRICGRHWVQLAEIEVAKIIGVLEQRARQLQAADPEPF